MSQPIYLVLGQLPPTPTLRGLFTHDYPAVGNMLHHAINLTCWNPPHGSVFQLSQSQGSSYDNVPHSQLQC